MSISGPEATGLRTTASSMAAVPAPGRPQQPTDKAFEIFVKRAITSIHKESWGRNRESKEVKDSCQAFLTLLEQHEAGAVPYEGSLALAVLQPLMLACASSNVKIVELALGALHKLVAHAWLQGESSTAEELIIDDSDIVTRVIKQVIKCGEISNPALQLSVIRALLTFTTAEHFVAHGDSLMSAVRAVFNLALGSESEDIKRTACNALLQILNTVAKRVTAYLHSLSLASSRRESEHDGSVYSVGHHDPGLQHHNSVSSGTGISRQHSLKHGLEHGVPGPRLSAGPQLTPKARSLVNSSDGTGAQEATVDARTAQLAQLAEQHDIRGLEAALGATAMDVEQMQGGAATVVRRPSSSEGGLPQSGSPAVLRPLTPTLQDGAVVAGGPAGGAKGGKASTEPVVQLTVTERDVLLVLTAFCKLASREAGLTEVESYLHQGKLLALELLVKVLQNPQHRWENVRDAFSRHLRQPLCITLLRNWATSDPSAFQLAIKLLLAVMMQPKLRAGLKAEMGAFYPLFVLLPLEQGCWKAGGSAGGAGQTSPGGQAVSVGLEQTDLHTLYIVLINLKQLCGDVQLVVDLFVNYDCDAQAPPLFERTMKVLGQIAQRTDVSDKDRAVAVNQPAAKQQAEALARLAAVRDAALKCIIAVLQSINQWAAPLRELQHMQLTTQMDAANGHNAAQLALQDGQSDTASEGTPGDKSHGSEAERLEAVWAHKSSLAKGIALFNTSPLKGVRYLVQQGLVEKTPQAVASFLRTHSKEVDKIALGEYVGHHETFQVSVMHAFIDEERYSSTTIDTALRRLLYQFRLPGEAQKIDRIMEKFAERFFLDNPGQFRNADGPYLLSFAIIMLNTDAHNPLAERRLGKPDFVAMCHQTLSEEEGGGMAPVLDPVLLEGIFDRIVAEEIVMTDPDARSQAATQKSQQAAAGQRGGQSARTRLASALGLHTLAAPFKPLTRSWGKAAQGLPDAERKRGLLELAERAITRGVGSSWVTAVHCELCRPMLTVGAAAVMDALSAGLAAAAVPSAAEPLLAALMMVAQLAAMLRLDEVCERAVGALAAACRIQSPCPYGSAQEAKQLAALKTLLSLTSMPDVGSLGSAWAVLLRTVSALNSLTDDLLQPDDQPAPLPIAAPNAVASPFNKMFQAWGISLGTAQPNLAARPALGALAPRTPGASNGGAGDAGGEHGAGPLPAIRPAPGAALVAWALTDGKTVVDQLFSISSSLDGEAVVVYFRALCAVSSEELDLQQPRTTFLQRLVHCAHANTDRIRLIWGKLWSIISAHLVASSCHISQHVALYSVDALRGLSTRLLTRAELAHFRAQEEALAPFVAVLRLCDDPVVRDATVAHLGQAVAAQQNGLGSGWRTLLDALARAGGDSSGSVVARAAQALALPVRALYAAPPPVGHAYLGECVRAAVAAAQNKAASQQAAVAAVQLLHACAAQLGAYTAAGGAVQQTLGRQASVMVEGQQGDGLGNAGAGGALGSMASVGAELGVRLDGWSLLLGCLADVIQQQDNRPLVANAAGQAIMSIMQDHSLLWSDAAWHTLLNQVIPALFHATLPGGSTPAAASKAAVANGARPAGPAVMPSPEFVARAQHFFPLMCEQVRRAVPAHYHELLGQLARTALQWLQQPHEPLIKCGLVGYEQLVGLVVAAQDLASTQRLLSLLQPVLQDQLSLVMAATYSMQREHMRVGGAGAGTWAGAPWPPHLASSSHMLLLAHRVLARLHAEHRPQLPWPLQVQLLEPLTACARQCMLFNQQLDYEAVRAATIHNQHGNSKLHSAHSNGTGAAHVDLAGRPSSPLQGRASPDAFLPTHPSTSSVGVTASAMSGRSSRQGTDQDEVEADSILEAATQAVAGVRSTAAPAHAPAAAPPTWSARDTNMRVDLPPPPSNQGTIVHLAGPGAEGGKQGIHRSSSALPPQANGSVQISLVRLEIEAAHAVIDAMESCIQNGVAGATDGAVQGKAGSEGPSGPVQMLHGLCTDIIKHGAAALTQSLQLRLGSDTASVLPTGAMWSEEGQAYCQPGWLADVRAPLLARAVLVAGMPPGAQDLQLVRALFPHLLVVMCSHQHMVREAVAVYFSQAVRPIIMGEKSAKVLGSE